MDSSVSRGMTLAEATTEAPLPSRPLCADRGSRRGRLPIEACPDVEELDLADLMPPNGEVLALRSRALTTRIIASDIVLVEKRDSARNGETVVACLPDGEVTLKRFYKEKDSIRLQPANARLKPMFFPSVQVQGVVVSVVRRL